MKIREVKSSDVGMIAYLILKWDNELPSWVKQVHGRADYAERAARLVVDNPSKFIARLAHADDGQMIGGYCINRATGVFNPEPYGQLLMWYVLPSFRGNRLYGLRLLVDALRMAKKEKLIRLEAFPWADQENVERVLNRLGFIEAVHVWVT